jgi:hypothetical protein
MSQEKPGFDMSKMSTADKIVLGSAVVFLIWTFIPVWYSCCSVLGFSVSAGGVSGFRGVLIISWILSLVAIAEVVLIKMAGMKMNLPAKRGLIHLAVAGLALIFVLLGLVAKSTGLTLSWGIFVGIVLAAIWTYGAYMMYSEPESAATPPPPPAGTGGFTS